MQSVPITTDVVSSNLEQSEVYNITLHQIDSTLLHLLFQSNFTLIKCDKLSRFSQSLPDKITNRVEMKRKQTDDISKK
jgi:hypothetical protein